MQLIISGNPNLGAIRNVIYLANRHYQENLRKILFIDNDTSLQEDGISIEGQRNEMVRSYIRDVTIESILIRRENLHEKIPRLISEKLQIYKHSEIIVDLTNGDKLISSALYASASLSQIENLFFLTVNRDKFDTVPEELLDTDYTIDIISPLKSLESIGKYAYFDIVYYRQRVTDILAIFGLVKFKDSFLSNSFEIQIESCISSYFLEKYPETIANVGQIIEAISLELCERLKQISKGVITEKLPKDFDGAVTWLRCHFCDPLRGKKNHNLVGYEEELKHLQSIDKLADLVKAHRNISSHPYDFLRGKDEAKLVLNTSLYILEKIGESKVFVP